MELESLPEGWEIKRMTELCEKITSGGTPLTSKTEYYNGDIPWAITEDITSSDMYIKQTKKKITKKGINNSSAKLFPKGTLLLTMYGTVGKVAITEVEMATNQAILGLIPKKQVDTLYLYYFLKLFENKWQNFMRTTTQSNINATIVKRLLVPIPPLEEQKKIVEILQFADYLKERRREAIKLIDKIVMSLFYDMFGDPATNPKGWEIERLDKICNFDTYQILPDARREYFYLGLEDIESNTGKIIKNTKTLGSKILSNKHNFDNSHVLYGKLRPYLNKVAMPMQEGICSTDIIPLKPDENYLMREFLVYYLRDKNFIKWAAEHSTGTKMPRIQTSTLKKHQIPLPPLDLQQEFAEIVSKLEDKRKKMEEAEEKLEMLYQILLKQAFTGKLTEEWRMRGNASKCR